MKYISFRSSSYHLQFFNLIRTGVILIFLFFPLRSTTSGEDEIVPEDAQKEEEEKDETVKVIVRIKEKKKPTIVKGGGPLGIGIFAGSQNGVSMKYWFDDENSLETTFGANYGLNNIAFGINFLRHFLLFEVPDRIYAVPFYFGTGLRLNTFFGYTPAFYEVGVKGIFGASVLVPDLPVDLYIEMSPIIIFFQQFGIGVEGAIGMRYYFSK